MWRRFNDMVYLLKVPSSVNVLLPSDIRCPQGCMENFGVQELNVVLCSALGCFQALLLALWDQQALHSLNSSPGASQLLTSPSRSLCSTHWPPCCSLSTASICVPWGLLLFLLPGTHSTQLFLQTSPCFTPWSVSSFYPEFISARTYMTTPLKTATFLSTHLSSPPPWALLSLHLLYFSS